MTVQEIKIKKSVDYKVLIKSKDTYYKVGSIVIKTYSGDLLYTPSNNFHDIENSSIREIDHISWHQSGRVSIKYKNQSNAEYCIVENKEDRQKISEIGFQDLIDDTIVDYRKLPIYLKKVVPLDVILDVGDYIGSVMFKYSMVSGKLIVARYNGKKTPLESKNIKIDLDGFQVTQRALGWHSGNSDVMLQYSLRKATKIGLRTNRQIYIPRDMKISKKEY